MSGYSEAGLQDFPATGLQAGAGEAVPERGGEGLRQHDRQSGLLGTQRKLPGSHQA